MSTLGSKKYWSAEENSPELVMCFVPIESALAAALDADASLLEYAARNNVALVSPVSLLASLKAVAFSWRQATLTDNARELYRLSRELYDRMGSVGKHLSDMGAMATSAARVRVFSDDGKCVDNPLIMRRAIEYAKGFDVLLAQHCEDPRLTEGAVAHEGEIAAKLGLRGWPRVAEEAIVARDALLCRDYGNRMHICHASTRGTVELVRWAKDQGIPLTAEVTPHHLLLTDERLTTYDGVNRVNPPLRETDDTIALRDALLDGTVYCVATDHAPHGSEDKCVEFENARPGMLGLESSLAVIAKIFVETGLADWRFVARVMSERPAEITRLPGHGRPIAEGEPANLTIVDPDHHWVSDSSTLASKSENNPYAGEEFGARVTHTILRGAVTFDLAASEED